MERPDFPGLIEMLSALQKEFEANREEWNKAIGTAWKRAQDNKEEEESESGEGMMILSANPDDAPPPVREPSKHALTREFSIGNHKMNITASSSTDNTDKGDDGKSAGGATWNRGSYRAEKLVT